MSGIQGEPYYVSLEVENPDCQGLHLLHGLGIPHHQLIDIRGVASGSTRHLIKVPADRKDKFINHVSQANVRVQGNAQGTGWYDAPGCLICHTILANSGFLISGECIHDYTIIYTFVTPDFAAYQTIISKMEEGGFTPRILEIRRYTPRGDLLTEKQERALWFASTMGFFDWPRRLTLAELADKMGISASNLSELLRRGLRRVVKNYFAQ
jgi:predicted DNA binding protein